MTWSPLACGIVSGKYDSGIPPYSRASLKGYQWLKDKILSEEGRRQQTKLKELQALAERLGCTLPQLAIAWCLRNEGVSSVLLGASNADQLMENIGAIQVLPKLSSSIIHEIDISVRSLKLFRSQVKSVVCIKEKHHTVMSSGNNLPSHCQTPPTASPDKVEVPPVPGTTLVRKDVPAVPPKPVSSSHPPRRATQTQLSPSHSHESQSQGQAKARLGS
ncbi:hypothetical protein P7K49_030040 [Saguinus oedipus]|uniref:NADP-dependent oxidoreductase domain-containing protein n=1 Tax=Saguinus oedipus TaxID=9490 RepID=A0ABQ9U1Q7_SAGOE|nr:hypothetical protein P7K49_030040 [Saguinus oedipus]